MAQTQLAKVVRHLYRLAGAPDMKAKSDGQLLRDFCCGGEQGAFTALVERHGAVVWRVCKLVLGHEQDAEDAFQATFLVLARKAKGLQAHAALGGWLHGVAYRVALRAWRSNKRRRAHESRCPGADRPSPATLAAWAEVQVVLSEEIARLPEKYRTPFVHCIVEGHSRADAAAQLHIKEGTVWSRLCEARRRLQKRLARRGIELGAVLAAASVAQGRQALPPLLVAASVRLATSGSTKTAGAGAATALAQGVLQSMAAAKLKIAAGVLLLTTVLGVAMGRAFLGAPEKVPAAIGDSVVRTNASKADPQPASQLDAHGDALPEHAVLRLGTVRFNHGAGLSQLLFTPDGKTIISGGNQLIRLWDAATGAEKGLFTLSAQFNQGTVFACPDNNTLVSLSEEMGSDVVRWSDLGTLKPVRALKLPVRRGVSSSYHNNVLSPDGKLAAVHVHTPAELRIFDLASGRELQRFDDGGKDIRVVAFAGNDRLVTADKKRFIAVRDARTGKLIRSFDHGSAVGSLALSADGRQLATFEREAPKGESGRKPERQAVHIWDLETGQRKHTLRLGPQDFFNTILLSPDGKVLVTSSFGDDDAYRIDLWDTTTGRKIRTLDGTGMRVAFSPDGKRLAEGEGYGGNHGKFDVWDIETGRRFSSEDNRQAVANTAALSSDGGRVATFGSFFCNTWDCTTGKRFNSFALPSTRYWDRASPTPHGRHTVSFLREGEGYRAVVWDIAGQRTTFREPSPGQRFPGVTALSADGALLAIAYGEYGKKDSVIRVWDVALGKEVRSIKTHGYVRLFFSGDKKTLVIAGPKVTGVDPGIFRRRPAVGLVGRPCIECPGRTLHLSLGSRHRGETPHILWTPRGDFLAGL